MKYRVPLVAWLKSRFSRPEIIPQLLTPKTEEKMSVVQELIAGVKYLITVKAKNEKKILELDAVVADLKKQMAEDLAEIMALNSAIAAVKEAIEDIPSDGGGASMAGIETVSVS